MSRRGRRRRAIVASRGARRTWLAIVLAGCVACCFMSVTAFGYAKLNVWREFGERFQLGYIVGYLDGVNLSQRHDERAFVPTGGRPDYERWRDMVNAFYDDPKNEKLPIPNAMGAIGKQMQVELLQKLREKRARAVPSARPDGAVATPVREPGASPSAPPPRGSGAP